MRAVGLLLLLVQTTAYFREVRLVIPGDQKAAEPDRIGTLKKHLLSSVSETGGWISARLEEPGPGEVEVSNRPGE